MQSSLKAAERLPNVAGAIVAHEEIPAHVALVDDVYTTGAICLSAAQALVKGGRKARGYLVLGMGTVIIS